MTNTPAYYPATMITGARGFTAQIDLWFENLKQWTLLVI